MSGPDPTCLVNGSVTPYDAAASATITITLNAPAGVRYWSVLCTATDELNTPAAVNATLTINQTTKTATCTLSAVLGSAYIFTSTVGINGLGLDANSVQQPSFSTTFKVNVKASNAARVLAENETFEQSAAAGWCAVINPALRAGVSVPISIGSTGFAHVTGGVIDANARAVNLASNGTGGDVTGIVPWVNGGRLQGILHVVNGTPGVLSPTSQIAMCESDTGTTSVSIPTAAQFGGTIPDGFSFMVADTGGAAPASNVTITNSTGLKIVDPSTRVSTTGNITFSFAYSCAVWTWDATELVYFISSGGGGSSIPAPGATISANATIGPSNLWTKFAAIAGGYTLTMGSIVAGVLYRMQNMPGIGGATLEHLASPSVNTPVTLARGSNTFTIEDPSNRFGTLANSVTFGVSEAIYEYMLDSTSNVLRCMRQVQ